MRGRSLAVLTALALLAACAQPPRFTEPAARATAVGKSKAEVLAGFGPPGESLGADGEERLVYVWDRVVRYGPSGPAAANAYHCRVTFVLIEGIVARVEAEGEDCGP